MKESIRSILAEEARRFVQADSKREATRRLKKLRSIDQGNVQGRIDGVIVDPVTARNVLDMLRRMPSEQMKRFLQMPIRTVMIAGNNDAMETPTQ
jgi:ribosome biogenesis protein Tsr3